MKLGFLLTGLVELLAGIVLYLKPSIFISDSQATKALISMYGLLALCFGIIALLCWKNYTPSKFTRSIYLVYLFFHMAIAFYSYGMFQNQVFSNLGAVITHGLLFITLLLLYLKDIK